MARLLEDASVGEPIPITDRAEALDEYQPLSPALGNTAFVAGVRTAIPMMEIINYI